MESIPEVAERISQKIESKGVVPERDRIVTKLNLLVSEFGIPLEEAERTVTHEMFREYNIGGSQGSQSPEFRAIKDLVPGEWVSLEVRVAALLPTPATPAIAQNGIISDETGDIQFTIWAKGATQLLEERTWYRLESAVVDEYRGAPKVNIHSGTKITKIDEDRTIISSLRPIAELKPGVASIRAKVIQEWEPRHDRMLQSGLLGDESGTIRFVIWKGDTSEKLKFETVYSIYYATADEYNGRLSLNITGATFIEEEGADIQVATGNVSVSGAIVQLGSGSGLIKRCPVEGCNRALSRQNYCPVHEIQSNFRYDLRITGVIDDGLQARNLLVPREQVERLTGMSLEEAIEIAENNPLGLDDVVIRMRDAVQGRYICCKGNEIEGTVLVRECTPMAFSAELQNTLINRAAKGKGGDAL
jgi:replication factor A1